MTSSPAPFRNLDGGVFLATDAVRILGMELTATMAVLQVGGGDLLVWSPVGATEERLAAVRELGAVEHLYAPNLFHHLHLLAWKEHFPGAAVHAPAALTAKRPDVTIDRAQGDPLPSELEGSLIEVPIEGFRLEESALLHRPSKTLLVADLVHHVGRPPGLWTQSYTRLMGFYDRIAMSRMIRWTSFPDRRAARQSLDAVLALPFDRIVVGHGEPITTDAKGALARAYRWLPSTG